jgi:hypothetical protein
MWSIAVLLSASVQMRATPPTPPTPVIVELFTSEGCSDCPPADTLLEKLIATQPVSGVEIIGLGEHVDYWDRLGWKDRFSSAALTNRQRLYQTRFNTESIYTPQMVVDGRAEFVGSDASAARKAIEKTLTAPHGFISVDAGPPSYTHGGSIDDGTVTVTVSASALARSARGDRADILVMITESGLRTDVKRGENHGRTLSHAPVVRYLATIGQTDGDDSTTGAAHAVVPIAPDWKRDHLTVVGFVQEARSRAILGAASTPLKNARP